MSTSLRRATMAAALALGAALPALAADADAGQAYVSNQNGDVTVIDLATLAPSGTVSAYGKEPRGIGISGDGKLLVLANREGGRIAVIDRASGKLVRHIAIGANPEFVRVRGHLAFVSYEPSSTGKAPPKPGAKPAGEGKGGPPGKDDDDEKHDPAHVAVVDLDAGKVVRSI